MIHTLAENLNYELINNLNLYVFAKDQHGKFISCNDNFANLAGCDSYHQLLGKSDEDLIWKDQADTFRQGDCIAMRDEKFINIQENLPQLNKMLTILVSKYPLKNKFDKCVGMIGSFIDITGHALIKQTFGFDQIKERYSLGPNFEGVYLTKREYEVIKYLLRGYSAKQIANAISLSVRTVEGYILNIRRKLQVNTKNDIINTLIEHGLTQILF